MNWSDTQLIAELLDQTYPDIDPMGLELSYLQRMVQELSDFKSGQEDPQLAELTEIQKEWHQIRRV